MLHIQGQHLFIVTTCQEKEPLTLQARGCPPPSYPSPQGGWTAKLVLPPPATSFSVRTSRGEQHWCASLGLFQWAPGAWSPNVTLDQPLEPHAHSFAYTSLPDAVAVTVQPLVFLSVFGKKQFGPSGSHSGPQDSLLTLQSWGLVLKTGAIMRQAVRWS